MAVLGAVADLVGVYKGIAGFYKGTVHTGTVYNFDHPLTVEILDQADSEKFYSANGTKRKRSLGDSSTYRTRVKKSSDLYDTTDPPTDVGTISNWRKLITAHGPLPELAFEGVDEADSASNKFLRVQFTATIEGIQDVPREDGLAAQEVEISGEILTYVKPGHRQAS
jgi:hypothetical protein